MDPLVQTADMEVAVMMVTWIQFYKTFYAHNKLECLPLAGPSSLIKRFQVRPKLTFQVFHSRGRFWPYQQTLD
jgi:hypothetical protein